MSLEWRVAVPGRSGARYVAIGLAALVALVPASFAQAPELPGHGKSAGAKAEMQKRRAPREMPAGLSLEAGEHMGVSVAEPIGKAWVGPERVEGEPSYVRRTKGKEGMLIVELSSTPFAEGPPGMEQVIGRPEEHPASW